MDIAKIPPPAAPAVRSPTAAPGESTAQIPTQGAAMADRADIRPLDVPAALQILLAEVRAAFDLQALAIGVEGGAGLDTPEQAARTLVTMAIESLPDQSSVPLWGAALMRVETALQSGLDQAIGAVSAWRDVPAMVVDAAKETRVLAFSVLDEDSHNPVWLRPEWAGLAPRLERFWRRRRMARRRLTDPDYSSANFDDNDQQRP